MLAYDTYQSGALRATKNLRCLVICEYWVDAFTAPDGKQITEGWHKPKGWPVHGATEARDFGLADAKWAWLRNCKELDLHTALTTKGSVPAYLVAYHSTLGMRLNTTAVTVGARVMASVEASVQMQLFLADVDAPNHGDGMTPAEIDAWFDRAERPKITALRDRHPGLIAYRSSRGYRIVGALPEPIILDGQEAANQWSRTASAWVRYLDRAFGIEADELTDWTRLQAVPHTRKDRNQPALDLEIIGDVEWIGVWDPQLEASDWPAPRSVASTTHLEYDGACWLLNLVRAAGLRCEATDLPHAWSICCPNVDAHSESKSGEKDYFSKTVLYSNGPIGKIECKSAGCAASHPDKSKSYFAQFDAALVEKCKPVSTTITDEQDAANIKLLRHATVLYGAYTGPIFDSWEHAVYDSTKKVENDVAPIGVQSVEIWITGNLRHDADETEAAIGNRCPEVYCRNGSLVDVVVDDMYVGKDPKTNKRRMVRSLVIRALPPITLSYYMANKIFFLAPNKEGDKAPAGRKASAAISAVQAQGQWPTIRPLSGITTAPSFRPDGTVLQDAGWDEMTRYLYQPSIEFPRVADEPSRQDAERALSRLREPFEEFPFACPADQDVAVAGILTMLARPAINGPLPGFVFDASAPGSGKTLLADAVCQIVTGDDMPKCTFPSNDEELEKLLGSLALSGTNIAGFDNLEIPFRGAALNKVLTSQSVQLRILGASTAPKLQWNAITIVTGNNVCVMGDTLRRCLRCRLEPDTDRPEDRPIKRQNLKQWCLDNRAALVTAALTLLRAFYVAGCPKSGKRWGSFTAWQLVSDAIIWAGGADITTCRTEANEGDDAERDGAKAFVQWMNGKTPMMAKTIVDSAYGRMHTDHMGNDARFGGDEDLRGALEGIARRDNKGRVSVMTLAKGMSRIKGRYYGALVLRSKDNTEGAGSTGKVWYVEGGAKPTGEVF